MRAAGIALALALAVAGCSVPDIRFFSGNVDAPPRGDGRDLDSLLDAAPHAALSKGYLLDPTKGIFRLSKASNGTLSISDATLYASGAPQSAVTNLAGDHLYVVDTGQVVDYLIVSDGTLDKKGAVSTSPCAPKFASLHPSGTFLAVGCTNSDVAIVPIVNGTLGTPTVIPNIGVSPSMPAFTPDGRCLYAADQGAAGTSAAIFGFTFDPTTGQTMLSTSAVGPTLSQSLAVHPSSPWVYLTGQNTLQPFMIGASCKLTAVTPSPVGINYGQIAIDPTGHHLYVAATEVYGFDVTNGMLAAMMGSPFLSSGKTMTGAVIDPGLPNFLYITVPGDQGVLTAPIAADGSLGVATVLMVNTAPLPEYLAFAP